MENKDILTVGKVAEIFGVTRTTIRNWHKDGRLIPFMVNEFTRHRYYRLEDVMEYYNKVKVK